MKRLIIISIGALCCLISASGIGETQTTRATCRPPVSTFRIPEKITFCGKPIPLTRQDVKERLEREFYYMLDKEGQLVLYIKRAARCNPVVEPILAAAGLPDDLKYVPVAESALQFRAVSPVGAAGFWQFMRGTAKRYGLRVDKWVDERRDLGRSTKAATIYLQELYDEYGSWETALAAYNWGERNVSRAARDQGTSTYYDLYLPDETDRFVFRIVLLKILIENPQAYAIHVPQNERYQVPKTTEVVISSREPLPVAILADSANIAPRTMRFLNPWMIKNTLHSGQYTFSVPEKTAEGFEKRLALRLAGKTIPESAVTKTEEDPKTIHMVKSGENLSLIALKYRVSIKELEHWNNITRKRALRPGQQLVILR